MFEEPAFTKGLGSALGQILKREFFEIGKDDFDFIASAMKVEY